MAHFATAAAALAAATQIQLRDLTGRLVLTQVVPANATEVTLQLSTGLAKGTYLVQVAGLKNSGKPVCLIKQ
ncbi:T9SS type A sorting domain-containing protein [Hymenobacter taeanensis]|uniref:T9SS type A sorting domain-containing protein n=1 Tax=Hymenobacter taeanensis TaxID=2735321 RepID=A0A6M6BHK7_9BACT|nr:MULTISPECIES: T9SS type A sorting domain-containing protein [Hymenobacter]QJX47529.1 T9SS type A sorting domain-containing protein [Hymenobacter taeanensis]UOQ82986.1 T9SS type A sorting domain-containing protein [Hymenobacter sp. 5414T-23]